MSPPLPPAFLSRPLAHRALHGPGAPENSLEAIRAAAGAGYGIEIDVQLTSDGRAVVFHDETLERMTGRAGRVRDITADALAATPLRGGGTIPTLEEALGAAGAAPVLIEVRDQSGTLGEAGIGPLEDAAARAAMRHAGPVAAMSFNPQSVRALRAAAPGLPLGRTTCAFDPADWPRVPPGRLAALRDIAAPDAAGAAFVSHDRRDLGAPAVAALRRRGMPVLAWTIRSPSEAAEALRHADQITFEGYRPELPPP